MARVIVVDDSPPIREILRAILESEGHSVVEATNGIEALELVTSRHDVMILDVMMPGVDGLTVLSALNARGPDCPRVIMLTAKAGEEDRQRALLDGADGFLTKPFDTEALLAEIERVQTHSDEDLEHERQHELYLSRMLSMLESTRIRHPRHR